MGKKLNRNQITSYLWTLLIFVSIFQMPMSIQFILLILIVLSIISINRESANLSTFQVKLLLLSFVIAIFFIFISLKNNLNFGDILNSFSIITAIYFFIILLLFNQFLFKNIENYIRAITRFVIMFSVYYLIMVLLNGLPDDRNSILGFVSSNYCATILYINYPILLYYLFGKKGVKLRLKRKIIFAMVLSFIVIILSGSRTAIGAVSIIAVLMLFYRNKNYKSIFKKFTLILIFGLILYLLYKNVPLIQDLLDRGFRVFNGSEEVKADIRNIVWSITWEKYNGLSNIFGSGQIVIDEFQRPAHNLILEIYTYSGIFGILLYFVCFYTGVKEIIKKANSNTFFFIFMLLLISLFVAYFQPFFSTGYTCGILLWGSLIIFARDQRECVIETNHVDLNRLI